MRMTTIITAIWLPIVHNQADYDQLPDGWKGTGLEGFNVFRARLLEQQEAVAAKAGRIRKIEIEVIPVKATPQYMQRALMDRAYTVANANTVARLLAMAPDFDRDKVYDV